MIVEHGASFAPLNRVPLEVELRRPVRALTLWKKSWAVIDHPYSLGFALGGL